MKNHSILLCAALTLLASVYQTAAQNWKFVLSSTVIVDTEPISIVSADLNGDGKADLVSASWNSGSLTVLTNNGHGIFGSNATYYPGPDSDGFIASVIIEDVNGDGKLDLIATEYDKFSIDNHFVEVLTNNGSGLFVSGGTNRVGLGPYCVIAADVNDDGKPDLVCANSWDNSLTVLTNSGNAFGLKGTYPVGAEPESLATADVNGDGKLDLICGNYNGKTLNVLTNNGGGTFVSNATVNVGGNVTWVTAGDINGDAKPDLICANASDATLRVYTNDGAGTFVLSAALPVAQSPYHVVAKDLNGDGSSDLISANGNVTIFTNNGSGVFGLATQIVSFYPACNLATDMNGDGRPDLVSANYVSRSLSVFFNLPLLNIKVFTNDIAVAWPSISTGWASQQNADLNTTNWLASDLVPSDDGTNKSVVTPNDGNSFFRLSRP